MSQAGILNVTASNLPPSVATSYVTNSGTAVPALNVLNVLGSNGITTSGSGNTVTISLVSPQLIGTATTIGATTANINVSIPIPADSATSIIVNVAGKAVGVGSCGGEMIGLVENNGGVVSIVATADVTRNNTNTLAAWNVSLVVSGTNALVHVTGVAGFTINWRAIIEDVSAP